MWPWSGVVGAIASILPLALTVLHPTNDGSVTTPSTPSLECIYDTDCTQIKSACPDINETHVRCICQPSRVAGSFRPSCVRIFQRYRDFNVSHAYSEVEHMDNRVVVFRVDFDSITDALKNWIFDWRVLSGQSNWRVVTNDNQDAILLDRQAGDNLTLHVSLRYDGWYGDTIYEAESISAMPVSIRPGGFVLVSANEQVELSAVVTVDRNDSQHYTYRWYVPRIIQLLLRNSKQLLERPTLKLTPLAEGNFPVTLKVTDLSSGRHGQANITLAVRSPVSQLNSRLCNSETDCGANEICWITPLPNRRICVCKQGFVLNVTGLICEPLFDRFNKFQIVGPKLAYLPIYGVIFTPVFNDIADEHSDWSYRWTILEGNQLGKSQNFRQKLFSITDLKPGRIHLRLRITNGTSEGIAHHIFRVVPEGDISTEVIRQYEHINISLCGSTSAIQVVKAVLPIRQLCLQGNLHDKLKKFPHEWLRMDTTNLGVTLQGEIGQTLLLSNLQVTAPNKPYIFLFMIVDMKPLFNAYIQIEVSSQECQNKCSGHGVCDPTTMTCRCDFYFLMDLISWISGNRWSDCGWTYFHYALLFEVCICVVYVIGQAFQRQFAKRPTAEILKTAKNRQKYKSATRKRNELELRMLRGATSDDDDKNLYEFESDATD